MRIRPIQFRTRTLIVLILLIGLALGAVLQAEKWRKLSREYQGRAAIHARGAGLFTAVAARHLKRIDSSKKALGGAGDERARALRILDIRNSEILYDDCMSRAKHEGSLRRKYDRASRLPWLPVEPDPPEPESPVLESPPY